MTTADAVVLGEQERAIEALCRFVDEHPRLFVLTGAGISTDSGIPSYRDANGAWKRTAPVLWQDFLRDASARRRYWARSMVGWPTLARAQPNVAHHALADLEAAGRIERLVTQNVDGLHQRAGSRGTLELHGSLASVICLTCGAHHARAVIQRELEVDNRHLLGVATAALADGDAALDSTCIDRFQVPACASCRGMLKPDVVFFGDSVPSQRVTDARRALECADAMLVVGSSLTVYSGFRFCAYAAEARKPIAVINLGRTRADALVDLKVSLPCAAALDEVRRRVVRH